MIVERDEDLLKPLEDNSKLEEEERLREEKKRKELEEQELRDKENAKYNKIMVTSINQQNAPYF